MARARRGFPCEGDSRIDVVPVDYCAAAILHLLNAPRLAFDAYHISAGAAASCTFRDARLPADGLRNIKARQDQFDELFGPCIKPVMLRAIRLYGAFASLDMLFDNRRLLAEGISAPPRFSSYAGLCALTAQGAPIASQMQYDFKGMPSRKSTGPRPFRETSTALAARGS